MNKGLGILLIGILAVIGGALVAAFLIKKKVADSDEIDFDDFDTAADDDEFEHFFGDDADDADEAEETADDASAQDNTRQEQL